MGHHADLFRSVSGVSLQYSMMGMAIFITPFHFWPRNMAKAWTTLREWRSRLEMMRCVFWNFNIQSRNHFRPAISNPTLHNRSVAQAQAMAEDVCRLVGLAELGFIVV
jgi:hypothetical protein